MNNSIFVLFLFIFFSCKNEYQKHQEKNNSISNVHLAENTMEKKNIYSFTVKDIDGNNFDFAQLKGKKIIIVNTASECGLTPQYEQLEEVYQTFKDKNLTIVGFPANNFGGQEPGNNAEIKQFCSKNYGVSFPMMSKISVKGDDKHPLYKFLTSKTENGIEDSEVQWNFQKYLINEDGTLAKVISPETLPNDESILSWIES